MVPSAALNTTETDEANVESWFVGVVASGASVTTISLADTTVTSVGPTFNVGRVDVTVAAAKTTPAQRPESVALETRTADHDAVAAVQRAAAGVNIPDHGDAEGVGGICRCGRHGGYSGAFGVRERQCKRRVEGR